MRTTAWRCPKALRVAVGAATILVLVGWAPLPAGGTNCAVRIQFGGVTFHANWLNDRRWGRQLTDEDLGPVFAEVTSNFETTVHDTNDDGLTDNCGGGEGFGGDLPIGTPIHEVRGYDPSFRLAARRDTGKIELLESSSPWDKANVLTGGDLFDIGGNVTYIGIHDDLGDWSDGARAVIPDRDEVGRLIDLLLAAPVARFPDRMTGPRFLLVYHLADGTVTTDVYFPDVNGLASSILAPAGFHAAIDAALARGRPHLPPSLRP